MTTFLTLGQVTFANFEIPERLNFGGQQALSVKQLVGGQRVIDAMGRVDDDISWSGLMFESTASFRAQFLDNMRNLGAPLNLTWGIFNYLVVIKDFRASFERSYQIPYSITCTVIQNLSNPLPILFPVGYNDAIAGIMADLNDIALLVANPSVSSSMALVASALNNIPSVANASPTQLIPLISAIEGAQTSIAAAIASTSAGIFS
ncbi:MAG TPA: hypothetical protein VGW78_07495 [Candidatus Babeliales bacterium]|jgi:hypothetical protein|nr:hypothetical protein [Candidatus Babeliales bacterium]